MLKPEDFTPTTVPITAAAAATAVCSSRIRSIVAADQRVHTRSAIKSRKEAKVAFVLRLRFDTSDKRGEQRVTS